MEEQTETSGPRTYIISQRIREQIDLCFVYHRPNYEQPARYEAIRAKAKEFAELIAQYCPQSREQSVAFTKVQEAMMWANASIAINEKE